MIAAKGTKGFRRMILKVISIAVLIASAHASPGDVGDELRQNEHVEEFVADEASANMDVGSPNIRGPVRKLAAAKELNLSDEEEQIVGRPWNFQQKFDPKMFTRSVEWAASLFSLPEGECDLKDNNKKLIDQVDVWGGSAKLTPRIFCGIFTYHKNHATTVKAIKETWASRCDGFVAFSDKVDLNVPSFKIKHEGPEEWENMWQKSRAIWKYINFHYKDDFDWFILGGDDIFIIVENLRKYLLSNEIKAAAGGLKNGGTKPMYLGRRFRQNGNDERIFNSGGAAYVLNQAAVQVLADHLDDDACEPHRRCFWEDVQVASCLKKQGVLAFDTRDALGRERFHPFTPAHHLMYRPPSNPTKDWYMDYSIDLKFGRECCSRNSISFHYVNENLMRRLYHLVYSCPKDPVDLPYA